MVIKTKKSLSIETKPLTAEHQLSPFEACWRLALTLLVAAIGGGVAYALTIPSPWLLGGMFTVGAATLAFKAPFHLPKKVETAAYLFIGMTMGSGADPSFLDAIWHWPLSLLAAILSGFVITACVGWWLHFIFAWRRDVAFFAAVPGALMAVLEAATDRGTDLGPVITVQILRLYVLILAAPLLVDLLSEPVNSGFMGSATEAAWFELGWVFALSALGGIGAHIIGVPVGFLLGSFAVSLTLHVAGFTQGVPPQEILIPAYIAISALVGLRIKQLELNNILKFALAAVSAVLVGFLITVILAFLLAQGTGMPLTQLLLAFAPGALEIMIILAFTLDLDPTFVAIHQLVRFCAVALMMSLLILVSRRASGRNNGV